ncbi:hypothetical protein CWI38_0212p0030 [Hamiltosporidium tvaerminnensis]|uniref:Uncharacterized protein n=1 Tax=Hamiltosporidium tvaerminnensis TaxID=1176355 RepID=A0A4V2JY55_9MICR|nr:hypothetical protein CWI37_0499p0010 [Hamiltosporidium tvaerminnensis]TBU19445.1 hypothetical protein CWI38_0212p0030 [Hamiltosporidium tvaerminnensis]
MFKFRYYISVSFLLYKCCHGANIYESFDTMDLLQPTCSHDVTETDIKNCESSNLRRSHKRKPHSDFIFGVSKSSKSLLRKTKINIHSPGVLGNYTTGIPLNYVFKDLDPLNICSLYLLSMYELKFDYQLDILKQSFKEKSSWRFSFEYLNIKDDPREVYENTDILNIRKCYLSINKLYRFFLLTDNDSFPLYNENIGISKISSQYSDNYFDKNVFEKINFEINREIINLYCNENEYVEFQSKIDYFVQTELNFKKNIKSKAILSSDMEYMYLNDFMKYWKDSIREIFKNKDNYIYIILPEFLSFEIKLLENLSKVSLAVGNYFLSIFYLKFLLLDPKIKLIKSQYMCNTYRKRICAFSNEECRFFLKNKILLKEKFLKLLEIFGFSVNINLLYSIFFLAEKIIYHNLIIRKFDSSYLSSYHILCIFNTVIFQMDENTIKNMLLNRSYLIEIVSIYQKNIYRKSTPVNSAKLNPLLEKNIILLITKVLKYLLDIQLSDHKVCWEKEKEKIFYEINCIEDATINMKKYVDLISRKNLKPRSFQISEIMILLLCLKYRIFKYKFGIEGYMNNLQYFQKYFLKCK